jgi:hypothetical protein
MPRGTLAHGGGCLPARKREGTVEGIPLSGRQQALDVRGKPPLEVGGSPPVRAMRGAPAPARR